MEEGILKEKMNTLTGRHLTDPWTLNEERNKISNESALDGSKDLYRGRHLDGREPLLVLRVECASNFGNASSNDTLVSFWAPIMLPYYRTRAD